MTAPAPAGGAADPAAAMLFVLGPTASGKTRLGVELARRFGGEIVSFDSRQVYRGLDLGSGKDLAEYAATAAGAPAVPHHLIDVADPTAAAAFDLHQFLGLAREAVRDVRNRGRLPVGVGGSVLYVKAFLEDYDLPGGPPQPEIRAELDLLSDAELAARLARLAPDLAARADYSQRIRLLRAVEIAMSRAAAPSVARTETLTLELRPLLLAPYFPRKEIHARIAARLEARMAAGMLEESAELHRRGVTWERLESFGLEYRAAAQHLQGRISLEEMREQLLIKIRGFCRSQDIWFRKLERAGHVIHWIPGGDPDRAAALMEKFLAGAPLPPPELRLADIYYGPKSA